MDLAKKTRLHNPQALFNLIRIVQEYLISKSGFFALLLLPVDITIASAMLLSYCERMLSYKIVLRFLQYLKYDLAYVTEIFLMIVKKDYVSEKLTEQIEEKEIGGTVYRHIQRILKFLWSFLIFIIVLPILPVLWLYDFLAPKIMVGFLYYVVIFLNIHLALKLFIFVVATFLVASTTVPLLFKIFVYIKYLFELKKRPYSEIQAEAETFFMKLYRYKFDEQSTEDDDPDQEVDGGLYYLFLKFLHSTKDQLLNLLSSRNRNKEEKTNVIKKIGQMKENLVTQIHQKQKIKIRTLIGPLIALLFTFTFAAILVFGGTQGRGVLGSFVLSVVNKSAALKIWGNFEGTKIGYLSYLINSKDFFPNFLKPIAWGFDFICYYFFLGWHYFYPVYLQLIIFYYSFLLRILGLNL